MEPGKSEESKRTFEPSRVSACVVNGAKAPTASSWPAANAAAAASVSSGWMVTSDSLKSDGLKALQEQEVVDDADFDADRLAGEILDGVDVAGDDDLVVAGGVVVDEDDHLIRACRDGCQRVVQRLAVRVDLAGGERVERVDVALEVGQLDVETDLFEDAGFLGDLPREPAGPGAESQRDRLARGLGSRATSGFRTAGRGGRGGF